MTRIQFLIIIILSPLTLFAQENSSVLYITANFNNIALDEALDQLNEQYKIAIAYDNNEVRSYTISANFDSIPITQVLEKLLKTTQMEVTKVSNVYIIKPKEDSEKITFITLSTKVEDLASKEALPYVLASVLNTRIATTTNTQGIFSLVNIADTSTIHISYIGYMDTLISARNIGATLALTPNPHLLKAVLIEGQGSNIIEYGEEVSKITLNPTNLDRLPVLGGNDVFRTLQLLPGVSGTNETSSGLIVRSSSPDKNLVLLDGYSLYHVDHFYGIYSSFNSKAIKNIQLYKGNFSAKYGGRLSSVMLLTSKDGSKEKFSGDIGANFVDINGILGFALSKKLTLIIAGRRSLSNIVENYLFKELFNKYIVSPSTIDNVPVLNYKEVNPNFSFGDANMKITYKPNYNNSFALSLYNSNDNLSYKYLSKTKTKTKSQYAVGERSLWGNVGASGLWSKQWSKKINSKVQLAYSSYYSNTKVEETYVFRDSSNSLSKEYIQAQNNSVRDWSLKIDSRIITSKNSILNFGLANTFNTVNLLSVIEKEKFPLFQQKGNQFQLYAEYSLFTIPKLETTIGIRSNYFNLTNTVYLEPKLTLKYDLFKWINLKGSWGTNNQMISRVLRLDFFTNNPDFWILADTNISVTNSQNFAGGLHLDFPILSIDIEGFFSKIYNTVEYLPSLRDFDVNNVEQSELYISGNNITKGIEVLLEKGIGKYSGWISYTLSNSTSYFNKLNKNLPFPSRFDQLHELKLANMYSIDQWSFSLVWVYGTGKPYSAPEKLYTITLVDGTEVTNSDNSRINNKRLPNYHRLDVSSTYHFNLGNTKAKVGLSIFNVYNKKNIKYRRYSKVNFNEDGLLDEKKYTSSDILLLGLTPSLFFNWSF